MRRPALIPVPLIPVPLIPPLTVVALLLAGCARPGTAPRDVPPSTVVVDASVLAVEPGSATDSSRFLHPGATLTCAAGAGAPPIAKSPRAAASRAVAPPAVAVPGVAVSGASLPAPPPASPGVGDARERARRALLEQRKPVPRRGVVPAAAVPRAEDCVHVLRLQVSLLTAGSAQPPGEAALKRALSSAGLSGIVVRPGPSFGASTGAVCVYGTFTGPDPSFEIGPPAVPCAP
ncbi:hypothetical protein GCM10010172_78080 [Paractinoplanes ferrugineus]|uniref:Lipoprotein n=1 Tax=Paractinoplanes ferrugineus TaxID=113564 RepID=A0A919J179_9ACTN|nr:hypothetical protein [Actinoplanes ferrugineus]GIE12881.1 hypothetical protein Afe05nite_47210 [Actinoplanes ferrugineus]